MSGYDSTNMLVLAVCEQASGDTSMLLLHDHADGSREYVVGNYFEVCKEDMAHYEGEDGPVVIAGIVYYTVYNVSATDERS